MMMSRFSGLWSVFWSSLPSVLFRLAMAYAASWSAYKVGGLWAIILLWTTLMIVKTFIEDEARR